MNIKLLKKYRRQAQKDITVLIRGKQYYYVILDWDYVYLHWDGESWVSYRSNHLPAGYSKSLYFQGYCDAVRGYILHLAELKRNKRRKRAEKAVIRDVKKEYNSVYNRCKIFNLTDR